MKYLVFILPVFIMTAVGIGLYFAFGTETTELSTNPEQYFFLLPIFIAGIAILITAAAVAPMFSGIVRDSQIRKRLETKGMRAKGIIMNVRDTGAAINDNPMVEMEVMVRPGVNTVIRKTVTADMMPREGTEIEILYDPANPSDAVEA
jgi:hypothetical protein